jgi:ABC-type sugar transport system substrate-binding protein
MKTKRKLALILAIVFVAITVLAGCSSGGTDNTSTDTPADTPAQEPADSSTPDSAAEPAGDAAATGGGGPNALADGSTDLENVAFFDPNFDYSSNKKFKIKYLTGFGGPLYEDTSTAIEHWAGIMNVQYDGYWSANGDNDQFLNQLQTAIDQGYDGLIMDPDTTIYTAVLEKMKANPQVQWMAVMSPVRDVTSTEEPQPLMRPFVGHEHYQNGGFMTDKLVEYAETTWPDVDMKNVGIVCVDYSVVAALHDRERGARDKWNELFPDLADNFFTVDGSSGDMDSDTSRNLVMPLISTNNQFTHWLVVADFDDYAIGAAAALDSLGLTDKSCVVTIGGSGLVKQMDAGQETAWRYALYTAQTIYVEPIIGALYAYMAGYATPENIWPQWVNENDHGVDPNRYAGYLLPVFWIDKDNYKEYLAWSDVYAESNTYPDYPRDGIERDLYTSVAPKPDYYN